MLCVRVIRENKRVRENIRETGYNIRIFRVQILLSWVRVLFCYVHTSIRTYTHTSLIKRNILRVGEKNFLFTIYEKKIKIKHSYHHRICNFVWCLLSEVLQSFFLSSWHISIYTQFSNKKIFVRKESSRLLSCECCLNYNSVRMYVCKYTNREWCWYDVRKSLYWFLLFIIFVSRTCRFFYSTLFMCHSLWQFIQLMMFFRDFCHFLSKFNDKSICMYKNNYICYAIKNIKFHIVPEKKRNSITYFWPV